MSPRLRVGLAFAFLSIVGGITYGLITPEQVTPGQHIRIPWDGGAPDGSVCVELDGLSSPEARALFGLSPDGAGQQYARIRMGASLADEGVPMPELPDGMLAVETSEVVLDGGPCEYRFEAWLPSPDAPFPCACSSGADCDERQPDGGYAPARLGTTLGTGTWRGDGCVRRACAVFATGSYPDEGWPAACPLPGPDGGLIPPRTESP